MSEQNEHAPDLPELPNQDDIIDKIREMVAKTTEEAIAPLRALLETKKEEEPPKGEDVGGGANNDTAHMREQRAAYERAGLHEHMEFEEFIKGVEV
jgi:hypothetical protein